MQAPVRIGRARLAAWAKAFAAPGAAAAFGALVLLLALSLALFAASPASAQAPAAPAAPPAAAAPQGPAAAAPAPAAPAPAAPAPAAAARVALVIGNAAYATAPLLNPVNDARAMAATLEAVGFSVILRTDATQQQMVTALRDFGERLREAGAGAVGLFYFAGHGMQIKGRNFLVPVGSHITHEDEVAYQSVEAQAVLDKMESAGNGTNLVVLDSCRDNPFARRVRSGQSGMAHMDAPIGSLVAFSTAPGSVAIDGRRGDHGLYTSHLLAAIKRPGLKVEEVFKAVRNGVLRDSNGRQQPWESTALTGDFFFVAAPVVAARAAPAPDPHDAIDDALWEAVKDGGSSTELYAYLRRFPNGRHAKAARLQLLAFGIGRGGPAGPAGDRTTGEDPQDGDAEEEARAFEAAAEDERPRSDRGAAPPGADDANRGAQVFTVGDRWHYRVLDVHRGGQVLGTYPLRIDRIEPDGGFSMSQGSVRTDGRGNIVRTGTTPFLPGETWSEPLPVAEAATRGAGFEMPVRGSVETATAAARSVFHFSGRLKVIGRERLVVAAGTFDTVRVEVSMAGTSLSRRADQAPPDRAASDWTRTYWMAPDLGMPVAMEHEERHATESLRRKVRHELVAADVLTVGRVLGALP